MIVEIGSQGSDATEATLQDILAAIEDQRDFEEQIWVDSAGTFYIRRVVYDPIAGTYTVSYTTPTGGAYVPVAPSTPVGSATDYEVTKQNYYATTNGTGFSTNDELVEIIIVNTNTSAIASRIWYNATTDTTIAAPSLSDVTPHTKYALDATVVTTNTKLDTLNTTTGTVKTSVDTVNTTLGTTNTKLDTINTTTGTVKTSVDTVNTTLGTTNTKLDTINTTTGTVKTSVDTVNTTLGTTNTKLDTINTTTGTVKTAIDTTNANFVTDGAAISTQKALLVAGQDGTNNQILAVDTTGRVILSPTPAAVAANSEVASSIISENITSGSDSAATVTVPTGGCRTLSFASNSGLQYEIRFSSGAIVKLIAGDSATIPVSQVAGVTIKLRPTSGNMVSGTDVVRITVS